MSRSSRERPPERGVLRCVPGRDVSFCPAEKDGQGAVYMALGLKSNGRRELLGFRVLAKEESTRNGEEVRKDLWRRGCGGCGTP